MEPTTQPAEVAGRATTMPSATESMGNGPATRPGQVSAFPSLMATAQSTEVAPVKPVPSIPDGALTRAAAQQIFLARTGFSPGLIDGKPGRKFKLALEMFQKASNLPTTATVDDATTVALGITSDITQAYRVYTVTDADLKDVTGPIPTDWNERAKLEKSGFGDLEEGLAEKGWCSVEFLRHLNHGVDLTALKAGDYVVLPDFTNVKPMRMDRLEVDLEDKLIKGFDASGTQTLLLHCSIARLVEKRPVGELHVVRVALNPAYTFNPKDWPEVTNVTHVLTIAPGPRCPVGAAWVGLDKPGYGMHGTVRPQDIGKTGSHGCFRLANWDAQRLARAVKAGMVVDVRD